MYVYSWSMICDEVTVVAASVEKARLLVCEDTDISGRLLEHTQCTNPQTRALGDGLVLVQYYS